jgi:hypothetical protein
MTVLGLIALAVVLLAVASAVYLTGYLAWEQRQTSGLAYYGRPLAERRALKQRIRRRSLPAKPLVHALARLNRSRLTMPSFEYQGVCGPTKLSGPDVFARAAAYTPRAEDVFVATQMRCGTTWMQQIVFQIVTRGQGEFTDDGYRHLYAISPWIDAVNSVSLPDAPLVGSPPTRIIKTHLPASLCPYGPEARYIYVARHPVSCFASIVDFNRSMVGPVLPPVDTLAEWFCSDRMYWLPWPRHVDGWWQWSLTRSNVLFVHYEDMKRDFPAVRARVADFLGCRLTPAEAARVDDKCRFEYMKAHEEYFEMAPPTMFSVAGGEYMASGKEARHEDVTPAIRTRIVSYCRHALRGGEYPAGRFYPELAEDGGRLQPRAAEAVPLA